MVLIDACVELTRVKDHGLFRNPCGSSEICKTRPDLEPTLRLFTHMFYKVQHYLGRPIFGVGLGEILCFYN
jgi:hypothetical protein